MIKITNQEKPITKNQDEQGGTKNQEPKEDKHDQNHDPREPKGTKSQEPKEDKHDQNHELGKTIRN